MSGHLEAIFGPMYAGKSEELIRRLRRLEIGKKKVMVFKPKIDDRYSDTDVVSHSGLKAPAFPVRGAQSIPAIVNDFLGTDVVAIDEAQFFSKDLFQVIDDLLEKGVTVIVAGLNQTFRGEGFNIMPELIARADKVTHVVAVCHRCGEEATKTQRLLNGKPAPAEGDTVIVGGTEQYEARCVECFERG